ALVRARIRPCTRVVRFTDSTRAIRAPRYGAAGIGASPRVVARARSHAAVRAVHRGTPPVRAGPWVVPGRESIRRIERIVDGIETAVSHVRWVVPSAAPYHAAPRDH